MKLNESETQLVGRLLTATVDEFYPTSWFDWDEIAALRDRLSDEGVDFKPTIVSFSDDYPLHGDEPSTDHTEEKR